MPIIKSAKKAARQAEKRYKNNVEIKKTIKAALKAFKANPTAETLSKVQSEYDKAVKKDLMKKNTASRRKAAVAKIAKAAGVKSAAKSTAKATSAAAKPAAKATAKTAKPAAKTEKPASKAKPAAKKPAAKKPAAKK